MNSQAQVLGTDLTTGESSNKLVFEDSSDNATVKYDTFTLGITLGTDSQDANTKTSKVEIDRESQQRSIEITNGPLCLTNINPTTYRSAGLLASGQPLLEIGNGLTKAVRFYIDGLAYIYQAGTSSSQYLVCKHRKWTDLLDEVT